MNFCTLTFFLFLAVVLTLYSRLRDLRRQNALLLCASYFFYSWWDWRFAGLMLFTSLVDFHAGRAIYAAAEAGQERRCRRLLILSVGANLSVLGFFKYAGFFAANLQALAGLFGVHLDWATLHVILPVGISFFIFQSMSYTLDISRGTLQPTRDLLTYLTVVSFFPQLLAGPIERAGRLLPQFSKLRPFNEAHARDACRRILWGMFKKMALADGLAQVVGPAYSAPDTMNGAQLIVATVAFAFQVYCDFSAYSDIAIGTAKLFGICLMENFHHPYFSQSVSEFWRRWHISLSSWFRDYVFTPLQMRWRDWRGVGTVLALLVTFLLTGLWHGASWNFVIWGGLNGLGLVPAVFVRRKRGKKPSDVPGGEGWLPSPGVAIRMALTFTFICVTWVFFRAPDLHSAMGILGKMGSFLVGEERIPLLRAAWMEIPRGRLLFVGFLALEWYQRAHPHPLNVRRWPRPARWAAYTTLVTLTLYYAQITPGQFIYFRF